LINFQLKNSETSGNFSVDIIDHEKKVTWSCFLDVKVITVKWGIPGWVNLLLFRSGRASHLWVWKISPKNPIFPIFSFWVKKSHQVGSKNTQVKEGSGSYLLQVKSVLGSVWVGSQGPSLLLCWHLSLKLKRILFLKPSRNRLLVK